MTDYEDPEDYADRDLSPALTVGEGDVDVSLRPRSLGEFIGQARVREQLQLVRIREHGWEVIGREGPLQARREVVPQYADVMVHVVVAHVRGRR